MNNRKKEKEKSSGANVPDNIVVTADAVEASTMTLMMATTMHQTTM